MFCSTKLWCLPHRMTLFVRCVYDSNFIPNGCRVLVSLAIRIYSLWCFLRIQQKPTTASAEAEIATAHHWPREYHSKWCSHRHGRHSTALSSALHNIVWAMHNVCEPSEYNRYRLRMSRALVQTLISSAELSQHTRVASINALSWFSHCAVAPNNSVCSSHYLILFLFRPFFSCAFFCRNKTTTNRVALAPIMQFFLLVLLLQRIFQMNQT